MTNPLDQIGMTKFWQRVHFRYQYSGTLGWSWRYYAKILATKSFYEKTETLRY